MMGFRDKKEQDHILFSRDAYDKYMAQRRGENKITSTIPAVNMNTEQEGSADRFEHRLNIFRERKMSIAKHHFWWFVHNCIAHVGIGLCPCKKTFLFHDWTSKKINGE